MPWSDVTMSAMTLTSRCCISLTFIWDKVHPLEQNFNDEGCMALPLSCQANVAFWQKLLPQVQFSLRTPREHGSSLFPIFRATNRTGEKKNVAKCCQKVYHLTLLLKQLMLLQLCIHQAGYGQCPRIYRGFPHVLGSYFHSTVLHAHSSNPWEPLILASVQKHFCLLLFLGFFFNNYYWLSNYLKWDNRMSQRLVESSKQTVCKFTWSCWTAYWI